MPARGPKNIPKYLASGSILQLLQARISLVSHFLKNVLMVTRSVTGNCRRLLLGSIKGLGSGVGSGLYCSRRAAMFSVVHNIRLLVG